MRNAPELPPAVLFVCTGNICRSPMAEYLLRAHLPPGSPWEVASAGTHAVDGMPASRAGIAALREEGIDMRAHRSRPVTPASLRDATIVCAMTQVHRDSILAFAPETEDRFFLLGSFDPRSADPEISDPLGASIEVYRGVRDRIKSALPGLLQHLERTVTRR